MEVFITILICACGGMLAGLSTGFAGLSAAVFITPFLVSFLNVNFFQATAIALTSDVLGSLISTIIFKKNKHVQFRKSLSLFIPVVIGCVGGSIASYYITKRPVGDDVMAYVTIAGSFLLGLKFIIRPMREKYNSHLNPKWELIFAILMGLAIGFVCGFQGAGGGVMILFALTIVLRYEFKNAIGTSVLIMTFTALIGAISHYAIDFVDSRDLVSWYIVVSCVVSTTVFAALAAKIANKVSPKTLNRIVGIMLTISCVITLLAKLGVFDILGKGM